MIALFDRAEARDFADVYELAQRYGKAKLLARASQVDAGFDLAVLADMMRTLDRFSDDDLPVDTAHAQSLREFFTAWVMELKGDTRTNRSR